MSIILTTIHNPFEPDINNIEVLNYIEGQTLEFYLKGFDLSKDDITFVISVNGQIVEDFNCIIFDRDKIAVVAKIEGAVAGLVAGWVSGAMWGSGVYVGGMSTAYAMGIGTALVYGATYIATMFAISYGMSALAGALAPDGPSSGSIDQDTQTEPTYSWGALRQTHSENTAIPLIFGANVIAGQIINKFITISGDKETLNVLIGICDHQIDSVTSVKINNQPYDHYHNVTVITDRLGTNTDTVIPGFNEVVSQIDVGSKLNNGVPVIQTTTGTNVEKIKIIVHAPRGFYFTNNEGGLDIRTATFTIDYKLTSGSTWTGATDRTMSGSTTEAQREIYTISSLSADQYDVRVTRTNAEESSFKGNSEIYLSAIQEIVEESLTYPSLAKYAVQALATEQLSGGMPTFTCIATRANVSVWNRELETHDWADKRATNPAWICYYLLVWGAKIDESRLIWDDWNDWADFCDTDIDGEDGFIVNTVVQSGNFWDKVQEIAKLGRATVIRRGTRYGVFVDKETTIISHLFTMGNTLEETFKIQYLPQKDRANAIEIEYTDIDKDYSRQIICVYSNTYLADETNGQKATLKINAAVSKEQAIREGVYRINSNKYLVRVVTFEASIDSFACTIGDLFYFQHETVNYEDGISGSRILEAGNDDGSGNPYIEFDQNIITNDADVYKTMVRIADDTLVEKTIDSALNGYTNLLDNSEIFESWISSNSTVTDNTTETIDPFETNLAAKIIPDTSSAVHHIIQGSTCLIGVDYNASIYLKANEIDIVTITCSSGVFAGSVTVDLTQGIVTDANLLGQELVQQSNNWYRLSFNLITNDTNIYFIIYPYGEVQAGNNSDCFYASYAQIVENSSILYPYIYSHNTSASKYSITTSWLTVPEKYDIFLFGESDSYKKKYRLTNASRKDDFTREITGIEYIPEIYTENDGYIIEVPTWTTREMKAIHVTVNEFLSYTQDGSYLSNINISWHRAYTQTGSNWTIWLENTSAGTEPIKIGDAYKTNFAWNNDLIIGDSYLIYVVALNQGATDTGDNTQTITIQGNAAPPDNVTGFSGSWSSIKRQVLFTWTAVTNIDLANYEIRSGGTWAGGTVVATSVGIAAAIFIDEGVSESIVYRIKAVDTSGIYSDTEDTDTVAIDTTDCPLAVPTGLGWTSISNITSDGRDVVTLLAAWTDSSGDSDDWQQYDIILEDMTVNKESFFVTQNNHYQWEVMPNRSYGIKIRNTDKSGNHTAWTAQDVDTTTKDASAPATPTWPSSDYIIAGFKVIGLNWNANTEYDMSHYIVERSTVSDFSSAITILGNVAATFKSDDQGLDVSTQYYYRIKAVDTSGNASGYSTIVNTTTLQVGATDIAADSIIASKIDVANLEAISANMGTLTTGVIESPNYVATGETDPEGFKINASNDTFDMAGFQYDPVNGLQITDPNQNASITIGNTVDGDYCVLDAGDITFYQYLASAHRVTKSLKRIEVGSATNGIITTIDGYWTGEPNIIITPKDLQTYDYSDNAQDQSIVVSANDIEETSTGSAIWKFTPTVILKRSSNTINYTPGDVAATNSVKGATSSIINTSSRAITNPGVKKVTASINAGSSWLDQIGGPIYGLYSYQWYYSQLQVRLLYLESGSSWTSTGWTSIKNNIYQYNNIWSNWTVSTPTTTNDITNIYVQAYTSTRAYVRYISQRAATGYPEESYHVIVKLVSFDEIISETSPLAEGTINYIAIGQ